VREGLALAAVWREELQAGRAKRHSERVSNTILCDFNYEVLESEVCVSVRGEGEGDFVCFVRRKLA
jgi:hypothetical protein